MSYDSHSATAHDMKENGIHVAGDVTLYVISRSLTGLSMQMTHSVVT